MATEDGAEASRSAAQSEDRKTETTLTTRIRINIPGSRPIPPVVVRTPVADADTADDAGADTRATSPVSAPSAFDDPAEPAAPAEEKTSDWFAPRKPSPAKGQQGGGSANGAGLPGASGRPGGNGASGTGPVGASGASGAPGGPGAGGARPGASGAPGAPGRPGGGTGAPGPLRAHSGGTNGKGLPGATGAGPVAPGHGGGTGSFDVSDAVAASTVSFPMIGTDDTGEHSRDDLGYFPETGPTGPTSGPVTGDGPVIPPSLPASFEQADPHAGPSAAGPGLSAPAASPAGPGLMGPGVPGAPGTGLGGPLGSGLGGPLGPGAPGVPQAAAGQGLPGGGLSDDTAELILQKPAPEPGNQGFGGLGDNALGHAATGGIPAVPPGAHNGPFAAGPRPGGPLPHNPPKLPDPPRAQNSTSAKPAEKKGRNKLVLLAGGVLAIAGGAYGAGLLMNHSDVPKGTTVLGVDIGGGTRDEAMEKLDAALGGRTDRPLQLSVDGKTVSLVPDQAGLQLDSQATVAAAAHSDYDPMSVIGSLFGKKRVVEPVMPVDQEKLQAALERAAGGSGSMTEGTIKFESGKAVAVYGEAGKGIDAAGSAMAVQQAYRTEVETGDSTPVQVPTTTRQPTISNAEVDRMMKAFAEPAMSANVTVRTDAAHTISFSPKNSLWKFLEVKAVDGKLVESYNMAALQGLYGNTFDGVLISRGTGQKTPVTVEDVIGALRPALLGKTAASRIATIDTKPS